MKIISLQEIKDISKTVFDFLSNNNLKELPLGKYYFDKGIYANVETYVTKKRHQYESHRKYLDIQFLIDGSEKIVVEDINNLKNNCLYDEDKDIVFYHDNFRGEEFILKENEALVLYPENGHMPCVVNENFSENKKIVFKIPYATCKDIKCLVMDVDGTLSDGQINMANDGELYKSFSVKDGYGIGNILARHNITPVIITGRKSKIVENRAKELKIEYVYQNVSNKVEKLKEVAKELNIGLSNIAYIGDDENDLPCINLINENEGLTACPKDGISSVRKKVNFISTNKAGEGPVRDFIDWIVNGK